MVLFLTTLLIGIAITFIFEFILKTNKRLKERHYRRHEILFGYHVHHSTIGLLLIAVSTVLFLLDKETSSLSTLGIGVGIIVMHTISSRRFVFIEKENFSKPKSK